LLAKRAVYVAGGLSLLIESMTPQVFCDRAAIRRAYFSFIIAKNAHRGSFT